MAKYVLFLSYVYIKQKGTVKQNFSIVIIK